MQYRDVITMILSSLSTILLTSVLAANVNAEDAWIKEMYKMSPNILQIRQICPWRSATTKGTIRLMQIEEGGAHRLYVQWLREGIAGTAEAPLSTIGIEEVNTDKYFRFDLPDGRLMAGACSVETIMEDIVDESRFRLTLYLMGTGEYEVHITRLLDGGIKRNSGE
jgi:hypothetical protein